MAKKMKKNHGSKLAGIAQPACIVGFSDKDRLKFSVELLCGVINVNPPTVYLSLEKKDTNTKAILTSGWFTLNIPSIASYENKFYVQNKENEYETKENISSLKRDEQFKIPILKQCPINLICRTSETFNIYDRIVIIARVEKTLISKMIMSEGQRNPRLEDVNPLICFPDKSVWAVGKYVSDAFSIGNCYDRKPVGILKHLVRSRLKRIILNSYARIINIQRKLSNEYQEEHQKTEVLPRAMIYPLPTVIIGSKINGKANFSVVANCGIISKNPAVVYISLHKSHFTNIGIHENKAFSINIPNTELVVKTDFCGIVSGRRRDKSIVFKTSDSTTNHAPLINECPINIECELIMVHRVNQMEIFIGEVVETYIDESCLNEKGINMESIDPLIYALNRKYWGLRESLGTLPE